MKLTDLNEIIILNQEEFNLFIENATILNLDTAKKIADFEIITNAVIAVNNSDFPMVFLQAGNNIQLTEGFQIETGTDFLARIDYCRTPLINETNRIHEKEQQPELFILEKSHSGTEQILLGVYPNLIKNQAAIELYLTQTAQISLTLYNQHGQHVKTYFKGRIFDSGKHYFQMDVMALTSGLYFLQLRGDDCILMEKFVVQN